MSRPGTFHTVIRMGRGDAGRGYDTNVTVAIGDQMFRVGIRGTEKVIYP